MLSATASQKITSIVQRQGTQALEGLVKGGDVAGLQKLGLNAIDAKILIADVQAKGFDQVFSLFSAHKAMGGAVSSQAGGQQFVAQSAGKTGGLGSIGIRGTSLEGVDPAVVQKFNLKSLALPKDIKSVADKVFEGRDVRIATAGYSAPPGGTKYAEHTEAFLGGLTTALGKSATGFVSSPTTDQGSIDALTTVVGQQSGAPVLPITAKDYVGYINPDNFPKALDQAVDLCVGGAVICRIPAARSLRPAAPVRVQVHLGKQDAKDLWGSLEPALHKAEQRLDNAARVQTHLGIADLKKKWPSMERGVADVIDDIKRAAAGARTELDTARVKAHLAGLDAESLGEVAAKELKETAQELDRQSEAAVVDLKKSFTDLKKRLTT